MQRIPDESVLYDPAGVIEREVRPYTVHIRVPCSPPQKKNQVGRRLWWSLVTQDAYTASNSGFTYLINLSHASTGLFANLDGDEIRPTGFHSPSKPLSETTTATYHILKIDFALVVRHFIDAINVNFPNASYEAIMELDLQFRQVYDSLPAPFRPDLPQPFELSYAGSKRYLVEQRIFMGITLHNRIMRLHRAYMVRGYEDPKYEYSTRVCLESAYALLDLVRQSPQTLCRWWVVLVQVWTGGLIISADLVRGARDERERRRQRDGVALAVSLLEWVLSLFLLIAFRPLLTSIHKTDISYEPRRSPGAQSPPCASQSRFRSIPSAGPNPIPHSIPIPIPTSSSKSKPKPNSKKPRPNSEKTKALSWGRWFREKRR